MTQPDTSNDHFDGSAIIRRLLPASPYVKHLGMQLLSLEKDRATLSLPFADELITVGTTVHGGAIASLIDMAATVAAWAGAEVTASTRGATVALTVHYLAAAQKEDIQATARVLRRGRSLVYLDVEVQGASGALVAKGMVTYKLG
jgi:uncharacterized protein (TIGR00369 family)